MSYFGSHSHVRVPTSDALWIEMYNVVVGSIRSSLNLSNQEKNVYGFSLPRHMLESTLVPSIMRVMGTIASLASSIGKMTISFGREDEDWMMPTSIMPCFVSIVEESLEPIENQEVSVKLKEFSNSFYPFNEEIGTNGTENSDKTTAQQSVKIL